MSVVFINDFEEITQWKIPFNNSVAICILSICKQTDLHNSFFMMLFGKYFYFCQSLTCTTVFEKSCIIWNSFANLIYREISKIFYLSIIRNETVVQYFTLNCISVTKWPDLLYFAHIFIKQILTFYETNIPTIIIFHFYSECNARIAQLF